MRVIWVSLMTTCAALQAASLPEGSEASKASKESSSVAKQISRSDRDFATRAASDGIAEVELGTLAAKKGENQKVRRFGERMVKDHSSANVELKKIAAAKGLTLGDTPGSEHTEHWARFNKLTGAEFDREYMAAMRDSQKKAVDLFRKQTVGGSDPELRKFAAKTLPMLEAHGKIAEAEPEKPDSQVGK